MTTKTVTIKGVESDLWKKVRLMALEDEIKQGDAINKALRQYFDLGNPMEAAMDDGHFRITPHRTDDSQDNEVVWRWKVERCEGSHIIEATIL